MVDATRHGTNVELSEGQEFAGGRYRILETLGRGGAGVVYRAQEIARDRLVALKQLSVPHGGAQRARILALFEREYRTLAELAHPSIVTVYDYGVDGVSAFYTMQLVEGVDLTARTLSPWREICGQMAEICSALSLVHSRGLIHRDVSPRNVRCTANGHATLIDFGALAPIGRVDTIVGSPAFIAPEALEQTALDARTDLFSVGATLYFALTGTLAYPARDLSQLKELWQKEPALPSQFDRDIPESLDALVLSLLRLEPALRPRTAAEVLQRLTAIAGVSGLESPEVSKSYLAAPVIVGRSPQLAGIRAHMTRSFAGERQSVLVSAASGLGRSRLLDTCTLELKTQGAIVLRGGASVTTSDAFEAAQSLAAQLVEALGDSALTAADSPELLDRLFEAEPTASIDKLGRRPLKRLKHGDPYANMTALASFIERISARFPIAIVVDDVERIDAQSRQLLVTLASSTHAAKLLLLASAEAGSLSPTRDATLRALAAGSRAYVLAPLGRTDMLDLFRSVFGDVPNLVAVSDRIFAISGGNPRFAMIAAQSLVDNGQIVYRAGVWYLRASAAELELPASAEDTLRQQLSSLGALAQRLIETQAIASHDAFTLTEYARIAGDAQSTELARAVQELEQRRMLERRADRYVLSHRGLAAAAINRCDESTLRERHRDVARLYDDHIGVEPVHHLFEAGLAPQALDRLLVCLRATTGRELHTQSRMTGTHLTSIIERGLAVAIALSRPARDIHDLRRGIAAFVAVVTEEEAFYRVAPEWLEQIKHDCGFDLWEAATQLEAPQRIAHALRLAAERYERTPERERVYRVDEAIAALIGYVVFSIAIAARTQDLELNESLPPLLEPFVGTSRVAAAIQQNAFAGYELRVRGRPERARALWIEVHGKLGTIGVHELSNVVVIRNAVAAGIGSVESMLGLASGAVWAEELEKDPFQRVHALNLRRVVRLQQGDWESAETLRKQAEELSAVAFGRQMFFNSTLIELDAYGLTSDLLGVQQIIDRIEPLARRFAGWTPWLQLAYAHHRRIAGDLEAAREMYERCLRIDASRGDWVPNPRGVFWPLAVAGYVETLVDLGETEHARTLGRAVLAVCEQRGIRMLAHGIVRALALAEAKLNEYDLAAERLELVIADQRHYGVSGLHLGATYETRARIAIWATDRDALEKYGLLTAKEYRHGLNSPLGARYERLLNDARRLAAEQLPRLGDVPITELRELGTSSYTERGSVLITQLMAGATTRAERARRALNQLCEAQRAPRACLYVRASEGLQLLATTDEQMPNEGLLEFATRYVERELEAGVTMFAPALNPAEDLVRWKNQEGLVHHPLVVLDEDNEPMGVVVLADCAPPDAGIRAFAARLARVL